MDKPVNQFEDELAALVHQRQLESLSESRVTGRVLGGTIELAQALGLPSFIGDIFKKALKQGKPTAEEMIENLERAAYKENCRIWEQLDGQANRMHEFEARLQSQEAQSACLSAVFHGMRTSDPDKHAHLGQLTINCIFENDLKPESLDSMMRAAVELTEHDITVLSSIYMMQIYLFSDNEIKKEYSWRIQNINSLWEEWWKKQDFSSYQGINGMTFNSSCVRLQSLGMIASIGISSFLNGSTMHNYELLPDGKKFYERLQEIEVQ